MVRVRALLSLLVLALFPVAVAAVVAGAVMVGVVVGRENGSLGAKLAGWVLLPLGVALYIAVRDVLRARPTPSQAPELARADHPELWAEIDELAAGVGTAPPQRIVVEPIVNATVTEAGGLREMVIGLPLLVGLTRGELRSVLGHELGHYGEGHTRLAALSYRASTAVEGTLDNVGGGPARWLLSGYAHLYLLAAAWANRAQEREADAYAARVAGSAAAASAFRTLMKVDRAWDTLLEDYLPLADVAERRPPLCAGLRTVLTARGQALEHEVSEHLARGGRPALSDSHPPPHQRIAAVLAAGQGTAEGFGSAPACTVLAGGFQTLETIEQTLVAVDLPDISWEELVALAGARVANDAAGDLARAAEQSGLPVPVTLSSLLEAIERGEGARLAGPLVNPGVHTDHRREAEQEVLSAYVVATVVSALCVTGAATHQLDWSGPWTLRSTAEPDVVLKLEPDVEAAVADPSRVPVLRARLVELDAAFDRTVDSVDEGEATMLAAATQVRMAGGSARYDLVACSTGLLLLPSKRVPRWAAAVPYLLDERRRRSEQDRLESHARSGVDDLRRQADAQWIDTDDIVAGRFVPRPWGWSLEVRLADGRETTMRSTTHTNDHGEPVDAVLELLGARAGKYAWKGLPV